MSSTYWLFWAALSLFFAAFGAIHHLVFVLVWNLGWLALYIYLFVKALEAGR
jgi:hypothetical protein